MLWSTTEVQDTNTGLTLNSHAQMSAVPRRISLHRSQLNDTKLVRRTGGSRRSRRARRSRASRRSRPSRRSGASRRSKASRGRLDKGWSTGSRRSRASGSQEGQEGQESQEGQERGKHQEGHATYGLPEADTVVRSACRSLFLFFFRSS